MKRIGLKVAYDGTDFAGYQIQPNERTVQGELESVLKNIHKGMSIRVTASGRTDTGVHARGQIVHFDTSLSFPVDRWPIALNSQLPADIRVLEAADVPADFHARYSAKTKEYRYRVLTSAQADVFRRNYTYHVRYPLDVEAMQRAAVQLLGTHDFSSFCTAKAEVEDKVRTIEDVALWREGDELIFSIRGNGFLYNMVRIIVGTLLEIGAGKRSAEEVAKILAARSREAAGKTAPGHGLILWSVEYDEWQAGKQ
ncbi:tRNA pseudouridine(38-40) synthase TruA [Halalkalibacterium halodurans]|uniref:tRNA pseudouridine(38-40) synthase TruA n=2 Tax=Halalkalibacterium halodurans TaxID=86665 RepID=UPI002E1E85EB|nr:tRNA pseudouridine(38-40) synthase TruA [Halalkalibacterium halodurans]MED3647938.1 tRNA pseudouridine(38-40) synthase TruA [Halalkalibacterium halodurans]MED4081271.1 tRNA pseudouridine(38-40) synthase TruA [Halalkalibacterium halodurans]MED4083986.1 tRNA pseudouridine(38-40) synthase TruA [Halalkalibacterium halodurans]MED4106009.1 tRNA pseudouridine(38-40) synthase TruA [Halalkalibacterium halodurans]MED4107317.1 tRNA pseudouridine(38-40) synthase TruA [Halalkalibacterium halodurans]